MDSGPDLIPFDTRLLDVGDGHQIYVEQVGRPDGLPALFLHGGPGSGCQPSHRTLFDPSRHRAVLFDQRGAGRSRPTLALHANTTWHLLGDIERIRTELGIASWIIVGGSWGSTLALCYAQRHPERVKAVVLRAVFLGRDSDVTWAFVHGPRTFRPELYERFVEFLEPGERGDPIPAYYRRLLSPDRATHVPAAWSWYYYERALSELQPSQAIIPANLRREGRPPPTAIMEAHYLSHGCFLADGELLANAHRLAGIPATLIASRYDLLCPPRGAFELAKAWPTAEIVYAEAAGHAASETGVMTAMVDAITRHSGTF